jgi:serine/threonine protein kinase
VQSVLAESALLRSLSHPNVLQLIGIVMDPATNSVRWMLTELANGGSLQHWLAKQRASSGGIPLHTLYLLMVYVMRGLAYLHALTPQVLHRDLKAANVLVFVGLDGGA